MASLIVYILQQTINLNPAWSMPGSVSKYVIGVCDKVSTSSGGWNISQICPKGVLYMHSLRSHFSWSLDRYNNRPNSSCLYHSQSFNGLLLLRLYSQACLTSMDARVVCKMTPTCPARQTAGRESLQDRLV